MAKIYTLEMLFSYSSMREQYSQLVKHKNTDSARRSFVRSEPHEISNVKNSECRVESDNVFSFLFNISKIPQTKVSPDNTQSLGFVQTTV